MWTILVQLKTSEKMKENEDELYLLVMEIQYKIKKDVFRQGLR